MTAPKNFGRIVERWLHYLNRDEEVLRRLKPFKTFAGSASPYPGPGPYPRPTIAYDPSGWSNAKGYSSPMLEGRELIEILVPGVISFTLLLRAGRFEVEYRKAQDPCLALEMPIRLLKEMLLSEHRILWSLADDEAKVKCASGIALSDWITILELLAVAQETSDKEVETWKLVEAL